MERRKIKLIKIRDVDNPRYANHISPGYEVIGYIDTLPKVGKSFSFLDTNWATSIVQKINSETEFETMNSIYRIEYINGE